MARDIAEKYVKEPEGSLPPHPLAENMLPLSKWSIENLDKTCNKYLHLMEVYVDDFCTMVQTKDINALRHISISLLNAIPDIFPPMAVSSLGGGILSQKRSCLRGEVFGTYGRKFWDGFLIERGAS